VLSRSPGQLNRYARSLLSNIVTYTWVASKEETLLLEVDYAASEMEDLATWNYNHPNILELKMEDLTVRPYEGFIEIFDFLGLLDDEAGSYALGQRIRMFGRALRNRLSRAHPTLSPLQKPSVVSGEMLLGRVYDHRFEKNAAGREKGNADAQSHYRKG